ERPPLEALDQHRVARQVPRGDVRVLDPHEVGAPQIAVADPQPGAGLAGVAARGEIGDVLALVDLPEPTGAVVELEGEQPARREGGGPVPGDQPEQGRDQDQVDGQRGRRDPGPGGGQRLATAGLHGYSLAYRRRSRWRTSSATVFTAKVIANSSSAARNSVR